MAANSCQCNGLFSLQDSFDETLPAFLLRSFGKKMFHLTTQKNSKGKRSDFLV